MGAPSRLFGAVYGPMIPEISNHNGNGGPNAVSIRTLDAGVCVRFTATKARAITAARVRWFGAGGGTITMRIETIDATTGKPTGTLYDANAVLTGISPSSGSSGQLHTFASAPTTLLTPGVEYGVVFICTAAGTQDLGYGPWLLTSSNTLPNCILTTTTAATRSSFAEIGNSTPLIVFTLDDGSEESFEGFPWTTPTSFACYGTRAAGVKFTIPAGMSMSFSGIRNAASRTGTPAGDLRLRILDAANTVVASVTSDKDSLTNLSTRSGLSLFVNGPITLRSGTYRLVIDSASSVDASNCWSLLGVTVLGSGSQLPAGFVGTTTTDGTSWTDSTTVLYGIALMLADIAADLHPRTRPLRAAFI